MSCRQMKLSFLLFLLLRFLLFSISPRSYLLLFHSFHLSLRPPSVSLSPFFIFLYCPVASAGTVLRQGEPGFGLHRWAYYLAGGCGREFGLRIGRSCCPRSRRTRCSQGDAGDVEGADTGRAALTVPPCSRTTAVVAERGGQGTVGQGASA